MLTFHINCQGNKHSCKYWLTYEGVAASLPDDQGAPGVSLTRVLALISGAEVHTEASS